MGDALQSGRQTERRRLARAQTRAAMQHQSLALLPRQAVRAKLLQSHQQRTTDSLDAMLLRGAYINQHDFSARCGYLIDSPGLDHPLIGLFALHFMLLYHAMFS